MALPSSRLGVDTTLCRLRVELRNPVDQLMVCQLMLTEVAGFTQPAVTVGVDVLFPEQSAVGKGIEGRHRVVLLFSVSTAQYLA